MTLYHWDPPQALQDRGGGWLNRDIVEDFSAYTDLMSRRLGDRVSAGPRLTNLEFHVERLCFRRGCTGPAPPGTERRPRRQSSRPLLAHGAAVPIIRANAPGASVESSLTSIMSLPPAPTRRISQRRRGSMVPKIVGT